MNDKEDLRSDLDEAPEGLFTQADDLSLAPA